MLKFIRWASTAAHPLELHCAAKRGDSARTSELLVDKRVDVNATTPSGFTPLHYALSNSQENRDNISYKMLSVPGIRVNVQDDIFKLTPLHLAIRGAVHIDVIRQLLEVGSLTGAKMNLPDKEGRTPFYDAVLRMNLMVVELMLSYPEFSEDPRAGAMLAKENRWFLTGAIWFGKLNFLKKLLSYPAIISHPSFDEQYLLKLAEDCEGKNEAAIDIYFFLHDVISKKNVLHQSPTLLFEKSAHQQAVEPLIQAITKLKIEN